MNTVKLRQALRMTQRDFAEALGVSQQIISLWENNKKNISIRSLKKIEKLCNENGIEMTDYMNVETKEQYCIIFDLKK